jgi:hypothetical protein
MSALPPKADIVQHSANVRFVPIADIVSSAARPGGSLCRFYNAKGFSIWNSYGFIRTSAAASTRSLRGVSNLRCGHESQNISFPR